VVQLLRRLALPVLWTLAVMGVGCGVVWGATAIAVIQPLVVISGSMEPEIMTGDLLIATKVPADSLEVGDVVSLPSALTDSLVTHRITAIEAADGARTITMKGDANTAPDPAPYVVERVRVVLWSVPGLAYPLAAAANPVVLGATTVAVSGLVTWVLWPRSETPGRSGNKHGGRRRGQHVAA